MLKIITEWKDKITQYLELRTKLIKLGVIDKASGLLSYFIFTIICLFFLLAILIFTGMGLGEFFAALLNSYTAGYFITAGIYILLFLLFIAMRKRIIGAFSGLFIRVLTEGEEKEEENPTSEPKGEQPGN